MAEVKRLTSRLSISDFVKEPPIPLTPVPENLPLLVKEKGDNGRDNPYDKISDYPKTLINQGFDQVTTKISLTFGRENLV